MSSSTFGYGNTSISDLRRVMRSVNLESDLPLELVPPGAFSGNVPVSDFAECLSVVLPRIVQDESLWEGKILDFPDCGGKASIELLFKEPILTRRGRIVHSFRACFLMETPQWHAYLYEKEAIGLRYVSNSGRPHDACARGEIVQAPTLLRGPMVNLRRAIAGITPLFDGGEGFEGEDMLPQHARFLQDEEPLFDGTEVFDDGVVIPFTE